MVYLCWIFSNIKRKIRSNNIARVRNMYFPIKSTTTTWSVAPVLLLVPPLRFNYPIKGIYYKCFENIDTGTFSLAPKCLQMQRNWLNILLINVSFVNEWVLLFKGTRMRYFATLLSFHTFLLKNTQCQHLNHIDSSCTF